MLLGAVGLLVVLGVLSAMAGVGVFTVVSTIAALIVLYLMVFKRAETMIFLATVRRDAFGFKAYAKLMRLQKRFMKQTRSIPAAFQQVAAEQPNKPCLLFEQQTYTFQQLDELSTYVALVLRDKMKIQAGDSVALFMPNKPEFVAVWLGAAKIGSVAALVNTNVRDDSLLHSLSAANCCALVYDIELAPAVESVREAAERNGIRHFVQWQELQADSSKAERISMLQEIDKLKNANVDIKSFTIHLAQPTDALIYIYTSGTTGLPKAAVVRHYRFYIRATILSLLMKLQPDDIVYDPLPLYHTSGGVLGIGLALITGKTVVIRSKFSASHFWEDCIKYRCTVAQYIGEMCRYLLAQPMKPTDTSHPVRMMVGNGLRAQVWKPFQERFGIAQINEFYGATEGNSALINYSNKVGACGFISQIFPRPMGLMKVDDDGQPLRDSQGMCIKCEVGEPGQLVVGVVTDTAFTNFDGYTDQKATEKKLISNVFKRGDCAFLSGDILEMDKYGFVYFIDRIGDTFRWKGENVSTNEVEAIISDIIGVEEDVIVYGVELPGCEGRAGMAAVTSKSSSLRSVIGSKDFFKQVQKLLPSYARPVFIRVVREVDLTGTFKLKKTELRSLGFQPHVSDVALFIANRQKGVYEALSRETYEAVCNKSIQF